jgi:hypothetical protein
MIQIKVLSIKKEKTLILVQFVILMTISLLAPLIKSQLISGSIVNAMLFVSTSFFGLSAGILIGLLPSFFALAAGLLPMILAPMIPFIITANVILVVVFNSLKSKNYWLAVISAGFLKFGFLFLTSLMLINLFLNQQTAAKAAVIMGWPQLFTVLTGGLISYLFLKNIKK